MNCGTAIVGDFIEEFLDYMAPAVSPDIFKTWAGLSLLGGALERRVYTRTDQGAIYPNLFVLLVAPPGIGKFVIEAVRELWQDAIDPEMKLPSFRVSADNVTKAALIDAMARAKQQKVVNKGADILEYHSLLVPAEEFSVLLPAHDGEFIATLNSIWNNKREHKEERRHGPAKEVKISYPQLNILGGAQPAYLGTVFQDEQSWNTGLGRRFIMVYSGEYKRRPLFDGDTFSPDKRKGLLQRLSQYSNSFGQVILDPEAKKHIGDWFMAGEMPQPTHSKLEAYNRSRILFVMKLIVISALSRGPDNYTATLEDVQRALQWLFDAEAVMPDIFRAMVGKSDIQILEELHLAIHTKYYRDGKKPVPESFVWAFLTERTTSDKIEKLIFTAEKAGLVEINGLRQYTPRPKGTPGREY